MAEYDFTNAWFDPFGKKNWEELLPRIKPSRVLEIGSFEGRSTCYLIDTLAKERDVEIHCVDTFEGGVEHQSDRLAATDMSAVEARFAHNTSLAVSRATNRVDFHVHKGYSDTELPKLLASGMSGYFDFVYVDGSHTAPHVLLDAVLSFKLLRVGGVIGFDDYIWQEPMRQLDVLQTPKPAVDAFINIYRGSLTVLPYVVHQMYVEKTAN